MVSWSQAQGKRQPREEISLNPGWLQILVILCHIIFFVAFVQWTFSGVVLK